MKWEIFSHQNTSIGGSRSQYLEFSLNGREHTPSFLNHWSSKISSIIPEYLDLIFNIDPRVVRNRSLD